MEHITTISLTIGLEPQDTGWRATWRPDGGNTVSAWAQDPGSAVLAVRAAIISHCLNVRGHEHPDERAAPETQKVPDQSGDLMERVAGWLCSEERGLSSETILHTLLTGRAVTPKHHPGDPSDLKRCVDLLSAVPEARSALSLLAEASEKWKALDREWDQLAGSLALEERETGGHEAPRTYLMMRELLREEGEKTPV